MSDRCNKMRALQTNKQYILQRNKMKGLNDINNYSYEGK